MSDDRFAAVIIGDPASVEQARVYQERRAAYVRRGDLDALVHELYSADARLHGFGFRAEGRPAIKGVIDADAAAAGQSGTGAGRAA